MNKKIPQNYQTFTQRDSDGEDESPWKFVPAREPKKIPKDLLKNLSLTQKVLMYLMIFIFDVGVIIWFLLRFLGMSLFKLARVQYTVFYSIWPYGQIR
jgi:hypothetical protein